MTAVPESTPSSDQTSLQRGAVAILGVVAAMWLIEVIDVVFLDEAWDRQGILPRQISGLDGVLWAPFLHGGFGHLASNTVPFLVLSGIIVLSRGLRRWVAVTAIVALVGGMAVWLLARSNIHLGASILVFGYIGYLLLAGFFERSVMGVVVGIVVFLLYGSTLLFGILPVRSWVSWEGHLFGALAGVLAAYVLGSKRAPQV